VASQSFVLDEDVTHHLASLLRSRGWNIDSAKEMGRLGITDVQVLLRAAEDGQTVITHNNRDFRALHEAWVTWRGRWAAEVRERTGIAVVLSRHAGILIVPPAPAYELAALIEAFAETAGPLADRLFSWTRSRGWHEIHIRQADQR
jgi:hypothetical protein